MPDFYRGKRVSDYRKQQQTGSDVTLSISSPIRQEISPGSAPDRIRYMKNFRGLVTIFPGDATGYNNYSTGYMGLIRWPRVDTLSNSDIRIVMSAFLHPVPFAMGGAPLTIAYEFKGITLGQQEKLWFVVQPSLSFGPASAVWEMLWAQRDEVTPTG